MSQYTTGGDLDLASLGTATGTRVDSPAKHIMACKMDTNYLITLLGNAASQHTDPYTVLHQNKMRWCMHKDEVALFTGKKLLANTPLSSSGPKAYPLVITTVGDMHVLTKHFLINLYDQDTAFSFYHLIDIMNRNGKWMNDPMLTLKIFGEAEISQRFDHLISSGETTKSEADTVQRQINSTPDFRCQGIALGQAFASHISGDTVASVLVGGVMTVQNGAFPMQTGDLVQWYFDFEENCFETQPTPEQGRRREAVDNNDNVMPPDSMSGLISRKRQYMDGKTFGVASGYGQDYQRCKDTKGIVRIKSYQYRPKTYFIDGPANHVVKLSTKESFGDKIRVFAKCISGGRPFDAVDIMLMTQSL